MFKLPFFRFFALSMVFLGKLIKRCKMIVYRNMFCNVGSNFVFDPNDSFSFGTISVGDDVFIGRGAIFSATNSYISIGNKVMFGPNVTIMGGDHNYSVVGRYMFDVKEKNIDDDLPVIIEDDVWIGSCSIILKGVTIGRGSIVAAGALVIRDVAPYSIVGGVPAKEIGRRFSDAEIEQHERKLGIR